MSMSISWDGFEAHNAVEPGKFFVFTNDTARYNFSMTFQLRVPDGVPNAVRHAICQEIVDRLQNDSERVIPYPSDTPEGVVAIQRLMDVLND